jgi:hypothetical protein
MAAPVEVGGAAGARLFAICWAFAILYHQIDYREVFSTPLDVIVTALAVTVIVRPTALALWTLAAAQLLLMGQQLPRVYNHWYVVALGGVGIVLAGATVWRLRAERAADDPLTHLMEYFAPAGRCFLVVLYFLTGWHKLNTDFLDPAVSCASVLLDQMATRLGGITLPPWIDVGAIVFTLVVELGVPLALTMARARTAAVVLALCFHVAMAMTGYARFSATGVALLLLFLAPATQGRILGTTALASDRVRSLLLLAVLVSSLSAPVGQATFLGAQVALTAWIGWVVVHEGTGGSLAPAFNVRRGDWVPMLAPVVLLVSGMAPYLGLQTDRALAMYSNLRTEGGITNHLLVPSAVQVFGYQRDLVGGIHSEARQLRVLTVPGTVVPFAELRARASEVRVRADSATWIRYQRGQGQYFIGDLRTDSTLGLPASLLHRKFLRFRPIEASGPRHCSV